MKRMWVVLWLFILIVSRATLAGANNKPQFEFGTIPSSECQASGPVVSCDIKFENTYSSPPLVFVMPTINPNRSNFDTKTTELPSDLRVWSVSTSKAQIKQRLSPHAKKCNYLQYNEEEERWQCIKSSKGIEVNFIDAPMENIDYLVIEEGVLEFDNGAKIVAGLLSTKTTISGKKGGGDGTPVSFGTYGLTSSFNEAPGVLVQLQSRNNEADNQPLWLTASAKDLKRNGFTALLERSEVTNNALLSNPEDVAFVAGLGEGFVNGRKFWLGQGATQNTLNLDDKVIKPITEGCKQVINFTETGFRKVPTLIASKSARNGPNGGWLRRCSVSKTGVSLINEEDMQKDPERSHTLEPFSYFLFDKPETEGVCRLFPSPAQTWNGNQDALLEIGNTANISGAPILNGRRYLGFPQSDITDNKRRGCDGRECFGATGLQVERPQLESFQTPDSGLEVVTVGKHQSRTFQNNESIGRLSIDKHGVAKFKTGTYWIDSINVNGNIQIPDEEVVEIHTKGFALSNGSTFSQLGKGQLVVYVHDLTYNNSVIHDRVDLANNSQFIGLLYSEKDVILSNDALVEGAVTARKIKLHNGSEIIASNQCFEPMDDYKLTLSPESDLALMCGDDAPVFTVQTTNNNVTESLSVGIEITPNANNFNIEVLPNFGMGNYPDFKSNSSGILKLKVTPKDTAKIDLSTEYQLIATLKNDINQYAHSQFKFVPFKFDVKDQAVVAGQVTNNVVAKVLACDDSEQLVAQNYTGTPNISHEVQRPNVAIAKKGILNYAPIFEGGDQGVSKDELTISESGEFLVTLNDRFECSEYKGCPLSGYYNLNGTFMVKSRPWKIAICDVVQTSNPANSNPATTSAESGFMSAGESFNVTYKPILHPDSKGSTTNKCEYPLTGNYSLDNGPLVLSHSVVYPASLSAAIGVLTPSSVIGFEPKHPTKTVNHVWNEVGTLQIQTTARYLEMDVDVDTQNIGRFYPAHLKMMPVAEQWKYVDGHEGFAYMSQPVRHSFKVEAQNVAGEPTSNYGLFSDELIADLQYFAQSQPSGDSLFDRVLVAGKPNFGSWKEHEFRNDDTSALELSFNDFSFVKNSVKTTPLTTQPDGPFNAANAVFGLRITDDPDGIRFSNGDLEAAFPSQPEFRYGRMRLQDVGSVTEVSDLSVPLKVEYWQHHRFVTNTDDNSSNFDANDYCRQVIWSESGTTTSVQFKGEGAVSSGESSKLLINQNSTNREQVRVWARIDSAPPVKLADENSIECFTDGAMPNRPWLRYNWREIGDEDPSSVITFGIYRGNDRIIFRGEPGLFAH